MILTNCITNVRAYLKPLLNNNLKRHARFSPCDVCMCHPFKKPCFDTSNLEIARATPEHSRQIMSFLYKHYWPREPTIASLWIPLDSPYLAVLSEKYSHDGDRIIALETDSRTIDRRMVGLAVANKVYPWMSKELEEWGAYTFSKPERNRMYFSSHCFKSPNIFKKYNVPYIYDIAVICTSTDVTGHGVGSLLLKYLLEDAMMVRHPFIQVIATGIYGNKMCEKCGLKKEWSMDYKDFTDNVGKRVFYSRHPHHTVTIYGKKFDPEEINLPRECLKKQKEKNEKGY